MRIWKAFLLLAAMQFAAPLHAQTTGAIANIKDFLKTCPDNDPAIGQIKADFAFYDNGVPVTSIPCTEPHNQMDPAKMNTELAILQSLSMKSAGRNCRFSTGRSNGNWGSIRGTCAEFLTSLPRFS